MQDVADVAERTERLSSDVIAVWKQQFGMSFSCPCPASTRSNIFASQYVPSRHGVHLPQDSSR